MKSLAHNYLRSCEQSCICFEFFMRYPNIQRVQFKKRYDMIDLLNKINHP